MSAQATVATCIDKGWDLAGNIESAKDIAAKDSGKTSDPFVIVHFINDDGSEDDNAKYQTEVKTKTLNPTWAHKQYFQRIERKWQTLVFEIRDKDLLRTQFIGQYEFDVRSIPIGRQLPKEYQLVGRPNKKDEVTGTIKIGTNYVNAAAEQAIIREKAEEERVAKAKQDFEAKEEKKRQEQEKETKLKSEEDEILALINNMKISEDTIQKDIATIDVKLVRFGKNCEEKRRSEKLVNLLSTKLKKEDAYAAHGNLLFASSASTTVLTSALRIGFMSHLNNENFSNPTDPVLSSFCRGPQIEIIDAIAKAKQGDKFLEWVETSEFKESMNKYYWTIVDVSKPNSDYHDGKLAIVKQFFKNNLSGCEETPEIYAVWAGWHKIGGMDLAISDCLDISMMSQHKPANAIVWRAAACILADKPYHQYKKASAAMARGLIIVMSGSPCDELKKAFKTKESQIVLTNVLKSPSNDLMISGVLQDKLLTMVGMTSSDLFKAAITF